MGQKTKIDLARTFLAPADVLIWDEPLNYLDIDAWEQIEAVVLRYLPTILFVETDVAFVNRIATEIIELAPTN